MVAEVLLFDATWLYNAKRESKLCTTQAEYEVLLAQGWADSPAVFGIETHPENPVQALEMGAGAFLAQQGMPAPFSPSQNWEEMMIMLQQMQVMLDGHASTMATMMDRIEMLELVDEPVTEKPSESVVDKGGKK